MLCNSVIAPVLATNDSYSDSYKSNYSANWLSANIILIFNNGSTDLPCNYRPIITYTAILLTSTSCKIANGTLFPLCNG